MSAKPVMFDVRGPHGTILVNLEQVLRVEGAQDGGTRLTMARGEVLTHEPFSELYARLRAAGWTAR